MKVFVAGPQSFPLMGRIRTATGIEIVTERGDLTGSFPNPELAPIHEGNGGSVGDGVTTVVGHLAYDEKGRVIQATAMALPSGLVDTTRTAARCNTSDVVGDLVFVNGSFVGGLPNISKADVSNRVFMPVIAVITAKSDSTHCTIQFSGNVTSIYSGLTIGRVYFVGTDGRPSVTPPAAGMSGKAYVQAIGVAIDPSVLRLNPSTEMVVRVSP